MISTHCNITQSCNLFVTTSGFLPHPPRDKVRTHGALKALWFWLQTCFWSLVHSQFLSMGTTLLISPFWRAWKQQYYHCPDCCCHIRIRFLNSTFCQNRCDSRKKGGTYCIKYPHTSHLPKTSSFHNADKCVRLWIIRHVIHLFVAISHIFEQDSFLMTLLCINIRGQFCEIFIFITPVTQIWHFYHRKSITISSPSVCRNIFEYSDWHLSFPIVLYFHKGNGFFVW